MFTVGYFVLSLIYLFSNQKKDICAKCYRFENMPEDQKVMMEEDHNAHLKRYKDSRRRKQKIKKDQTQRKAKENS